MHKKFLQIVSPIHSGKIPIADGRELAELEKQAVQHNIWQLFYTRLHEANVQSPNNVIATFLTEKKKQYLFNVAQLIKQQTVQESLLQKLAKAGIPAVILKGSSLAKHIYNDIHSRSSCDIDILIHEADIDSTHAIMLKNSYICSSDAELAFWVLRLHHISYRQDRSNTNTPVEIHWNFSIPGFFRLSSKDIWQHVEYDEYGQARLTPEMMLVQLLLHHHRHAFQEFRNLVDLFWAFHRYDTEIEWLDFSKRIEKIGLIKASGLICHQIEQYWSEDSTKLAGFKTFKKAVDERCSSSFTPNLLRRCLPDFEETKFSTRQKLLYRMSLDRWHTVVLSFLKTILPPPGAIKKLYNDSSNLRLAGHYFSYFRWRFFKARSHH